MSLEAFAQGLDEGVQAGVLTDAGGMRGVERRTARTWLHLLGYLDRDNERGTADDALRDGLARFRRDVGLAGGDSDLDDAALDALTRLVAFDADVDADRRFDGFASDNPVVRRAVALRLYALDLVPHLPSRADDAEVAGGLERFARVRALLGFDTSTRVDLFDLDAVRTRLVAEDQQLTIVHPAGSSSRDRKDNRELVERYVQAVARIELWLIGYLTRPRRQLWARDQTNKSLPHALRQFWRDQPLDVQPPPAQREDLDGHFFQRVRTVMSQGEAADADAAIVDQLAEDAGLARSVRDETRSLGARILDGLRRAARFVIGWIRLGLKGLAALARNLARVISERVRSVFAAAREVVLALPEVWAFLNGRPLAGSDARHLVMSTNVDFDFTLIWNTAADPARVSVFSRRVLYSARLFAAVAAVVNRLIGTFVRIGRRIAFGGWFGVVLTLLRARAWVAEMADLVADVTRWRMGLEGVQVARSGE